MTNEPLTHAPLSDAVLGAALQARAAGGRCNAFAVEGASMWPSLHAADVVILDPHHRSFCPGDILAYRCGERLVVHRVLSSRAGWVVTAGDCLPQVDPAVPTEKVLGRAIVVQTAARTVDLQTTTAQALGRLVALCHPLRRHRGLRRGAAWITSLTAWYLRR